GGGGPVLSVVGGRDAEYDALGRVQAGVEGQQAHRVALGVVGVQRLGLALLVVGDQGVGGGQDRFGAAVVQVERDDAGVGEVALEVENVADVRTAPFINTLIRVSDHTDVRLVNRQPAGDLVLGGVRVLVFVDQNEAEAAVQFGTHLLIVLQSEGGL